MKFYIDYVDTEGNMYTYHTTAFTKKQAEDKLFNEVYDVDFILNIRTSR